MKFVAAEGEVPLSKCTKKHLKFPTKLYQVGSFVGVFLAYFIEDLQ
jgi:hypothetical protein